MRAVSYPARDAPNAFFFQHFLSSHVSNNKIKCVQFHILAREATNALFFSLLSIYLLSLKLIKGFSSS